MTKPLKILYAEDDTNVVEAVSSILKLKGIELDIAHDGLELVKLFDTNRDYDIIISDIQMPKLSGLEAIKKLKSKNQKFYTIVTTAYGNTEYLLDSINIGIDKYLIKPIDIDKLLEIIDSYEHQQQLIEDFSRQKDLLLLQARSSTIGLLLDSIAQQWIEPLYSIRFASDSLKYQIEKGELSKEDFIETNKKINTQIDSMFEILEKFRSLLRGGVNKSKFHIQDLIDLSFNVIKKDLEAKDIKYECEVVNNFVLYGYKNQIIYIILTLFILAKKSFITDLKKEKKIELVVLETPDTYQITYYDNAGENKQRDKEFSQSYSVKDQEGIFLYLAGQILDEHYGNMTVSSDGNGFEVKIDFKKEFFSDFIENIDLY